ncbi:hypothetical protein HERIO_1615 [Hepatospora eriocheir]|uniref:Uncharacterized protein n=1 Tax=Hepatospora eriocheir TaxID=1081669 RepID=A0A1X0Q9J9_9MICR|nr:hypothetical protein HERIO_1615 [Hepatospora eriocheir]
MGTDKRVLDKILRKKKEIYNDIRSKINKTENKANKLLQKTTGNNLKELKVKSTQFLKEMDRNIEKKKKVINRIRRSIDKVNKLYEKLNNSSVVDEMKEFKENFAADLNKKIEEINKFKSEQDAFYKKEFNKLNKEADKILKD